jgi:Uncharacterized protein conserved in bacteria (DUF2066)
MQRAERTGVSGRVLGVLAGAMLACATLAWAPHVQASDAVYTVGNYPVDARAADAVAAKATAIADGQKAALRSLLKRLVPVTAYPRLRKLQIAKADPYLSGISVRSERNSTTEYIANLDFSFRPEAVRALLDRENLPYVDAQAPAITIVPIWMAETQPIPGVSADAWRNAWAAVDVAHALTPAKLDVLKPGVHTDTVAALAKGDTTMLRTFASAYSGEERLVAAILVPLPKERKLQVTLVGRDTVGSLAWIKGYKFDAEDPAYAIELAAVVSLGVLEGRWKAAGARVQGPVRIPGTDQVAAAPAVGGSGDEGLRMSVEFANMSEWSDISKRLGQVPGVENIDVIGMSGRSARITLRYPEGAQRLADVAAQHGLTMRQNSGGWVLSGGR